MKDKLQEMIMLDELRPDVKMSRKINKSLSWDVIDILDHELGEIFLFDHRPFVIQIMDALEMEG